MMRSMKTKRDLRKDERNLRRQPGRQAIQGYEIRVAGHLESGAFDWFGEVVISNLENGDALLSGAIPDQPALLRVLLRLHDLGITILSVKALKRRR